MEGVGGIWVRRRTKVLLGPLCRPCKVVLEGNRSRYCSQAKLPQRYHQECKSGKCGSAYTSTQMRKTPINYYNLLG